MEELAALLKTLKHTSPSEEDQSSLWLRLTEVLSSAWAVKQGLSLSIPLSFPVHISSALRTADNPLQRRRSFECLHALLALPVASVLLAQLDTAVRLLSAMMEYTVDLLAAPDGHLSSEVYHTLVLLVSHFSSVVDRHGNAKKVFVSVVSLLEPYILLQWSLHHEGCSEGVVVGKAELMQALDQVPTSLLAEECLAELQHYLSIDGGGKKKYNKAPVSYVEGLFTLLSSCAVKKRAALTHFLPQFFLLFLTRNQKVKLVKKHCEFGLLVKFGALLGFHGDLKSGAGHVTLQFMECSMEEKACVLHSLSKCLSLAGDYGVYLATEDSGYQLKWLQALCRCLINGEAGLESTAGFYPCLSALLQLNHLSVEPFLPAVWTKVLDQEDQDSSCEEFCNVVIATYSKLHQLHRLLEMAVQGAMESSSIRLSRIFPGAVGAEFERALSSTPPGQSSDILNWLCGRVAEVCLPPLSARVSAEGPPKKKKRRLISLLSNSHQVVLLRVCDVVCQVLCHLPVDGWQGRSAEGAHRGLRRMTLEGAMELLDMATKLPLGSKEHLTAATCTLLLMYGVHKLSLVLRSTVTTDLSLPLVTSGDLSDLAVSPLCKHLIGQITLLDVLSCQLPCEAGVHQLMQVPKPSEAEADICSATWNGETLSITSDGSSLVSSWQLTLQALPHVWPAMTADGLHDIAALVLKVLTSAVKCRDSQLRTMRSVTVEFLGSAVFQVMDSLHCRLVDTTVEFVDRKLLDHSRFGKPFRKLVLRVLRLGRSSEEEQLDLSGLLRVGGGVKGERRPFTEEEVEEWVVSLRGIVEMIMFLPLHGVPLDALHQVTTVVMATDILAFKLLQDPVYSGSNSFLQCACDVRTVLAHAVRCGGRRGTSPPWFQDVLLRWAWLSAPPMGRKDKPSSLLLASVCVVQSVVQLTSETELSRVVHLMCEDLLQLDQTSHHLMLKAAVNQCCNSGINCSPPPLHGCPHAVPVRTQNKEKAEATQLMLGSLLASVLQLPSTPKDTPGDISHLVDLVSALGQLAASNLESWSLAVPHTMDEGETVADCITVLCLPSLLGGNEIVAMEKWVEPWCTLLRFMKKMAASGMSGAEQIVFDSKVANTVCSLVLNSQRSQLKEMFMHIFDIGASDGWSEHYRVVFLRVWSTVLGIPALPTDGRKEVRRWMSRVAITAVEMVGGGVTGEGVLKGALDVLHKLSGFPNHVGMDKQTAILVVHGLSVVEVKESRQLLPWGSTLQFGIQLARILLSLWRHYEKTVLTNFISFMAVVRKILLIIGSELRAGPSHGDTRLLEECCSHFVVIAEQISRQKKLAKFAPYLILDALNMLQQGPAPPLIEQLLSSGVHSLLDVCGEKDVVFLRASLDPSNRDLFSTLLTNYHKHHKFTGQV